MSDPRFFKKQYADFCAAHYVPIHGQPWWLDAVCGAENWGVSLAFDKAGAVIGALPFGCLKKGWWSACRMPPMTATLPLTLVYPMGQKSHSKYAFEQEVIGRLVEQLPEVLVFDQNYAAEFENWLPFYWRGYAQTARYTYRIAPLPDPEQLYKMVKGSVRTDLKKAERNGIRITTSEDVGAFYDFIRPTYIRRGGRMSFSKKALARLDEVLKARGQREILVAKDGEGNTHAAGYVVWDDRMAFYMMSGTDVRFRNSAAHVKVVWEAIRRVSKKGVGVFDFEGSMDRGLGHFFRAFGSQAVPYFRIYRIRNKALRVAASLLGRG
ncbi:MAG: GNAT family N-acetyltransferase [Bacteroidetes bacterium]|nr:MAG: GNAT family N-acetyltransferase [Bacteroidota bacterium]